MIERGKKYLSDILIAIEYVEEFVSDVNTYNDYQNDIRTKSAVERQ